MRHPRKFIKPVAKAIGAVALLAALFTVFSAPAFPPPINIREADGNPILWGVRQLTVPNGWLGASSGGVATISASAVGSTVNADDITTGTLALARGGLGASLTDPGADRILFWDDSAGANTWLSPGNSLAITTTTLDAIQDIRTSASPTFLASTLSQTALGTTSTDGLVLQNTTAAAAGAQQISSRVRWTGQGWETNTGSSQQTDYVAQLVPVQGAAAPQARLDFNYAINGGALQATPTMSLLNGNVGIGTTGPGALLDVFKAGTNDPLVQFGSTEAEDAHTITLRNGSGELDLFVAGGVDNFITGVTQGDVGMFFTAGDDFLLGNKNVAPYVVVKDGGNIGIGTTSFGTNAAKVLSFGGPATAPTTRPADVFTFYPFDVNGALTMGMAWMSEDNGIGILGLRNGFGTITPDQFAEFEQLETITGAVTDGYAAALRLDPGYTAATALTVTRHNYIDVQNVSVAGAGPAAVTNAALFRFDAAAGTHLAVAAGVGNFDSGFIKVNLNGTLGYVGISSAAASATTTNANTLTIAADEDANEASSALIFEVDNVEVGRFNVGGNLLLNAAAPGESLLNGIVVPSGVAPTTRPADMVQFYVADQNGTATWGALNIVAETLSRYEIGADGIYTYRTDVAHGMTLVVPTDLAFRLHSSSSGGMNIDGYADTGVAGVLMQGFGASSDTTKSTSTLGHIDLRAWVKNGTTADAAAADSSMLTVRAGNTATRFILDADGDSHQDVGTAWTNFDEYDDVRLVNSLAASVSRPENPIKAEFVSFISHNKNQLEATGLVAYNEDGHHFVNMSKLTMLNTSAIRQVGLKVYEMERVIQAQAEEIQELRSRLSGMRTAKFSAVAP